MLVSYAVLTPSDSSAQAKYVAKPNAVLLETYFSEALLCTPFLPLSSESLKKDLNITQSWRQTTKPVELYLKQLAPKSSQERDRLPDTAISFKAYGVNFDRYNLIMAYGLLAVTASSESGDLQALLKSLSQRGYTFKLQSDTKNQLITTTNESYVASKKINYNQDLVITVSRGQHLIRGFIDKSGLTISCTGKELSSEEVGQRYGIPSHWDIQKIAREKKQMPSEWADRIIASGFAEPMTALADYLYLTPLQVDQILKSDTAGLGVRFVVNAEQKLTEEQIDNLIESKHTDVIRVMVQRRFSQLSEAHKVKLHADPIGSHYLQLRTSKSYALADLKRQLTAETSSNIRPNLYDLNAAGQLQGRVADYLLLHPRGAVRQHFTMDYPVPLTVDQIEIALKDTIPGVRIGVLRRSDLSITRAQYDAGINHPDKDLRFWYGQRKEHLPTAEQLESGLTDIDGPTKRGWVLDKRISLTESQIQRAKADPVTADLFPAPTIKINLPRRSNDPPCGGTDYFGRSLTADAPCDSSGVQR